MSVTLMANGEVREYRNVRLYMSHTNMQRYNDLLGTEYANKVSLSQLLDGLFGDWLTVQELKQEFAKLNTST